MSIEVNWADVTLGLIVLAAGVTAAAVYCFLEYHRIKAEERRQRRRFEQDMASAELAPWDGQTYDWDEQSLAYLSDTNVYAGPGVADTLAFEQVPEAPVPPSTISGPLPVMEGDNDNDFLARMKAENAAFLEGLNRYASA